MPSHEKFLELGALAAIGEITASEDQELGSHLRECTDCREAYAEYSSILRQDLPQANPPHRRSSERLLPRTPDGELREHFLARARALGLEFSAGVDRPVIPIQSQLFRRSAFVAGWSVAAAALVISMGVLIATRHWERRPTMRAVASIAPVPVQPSAAVTPVKHEDRFPRESIREEKLQSLEEQNLDLSSILKEHENELEQLQHQLADVNSQLSQLRSERYDLLASRDRDQAQIAELKNQVQGSNASSVAAMVELQDRIRTLNAALQEQTQKLEMERQMASVSSDVRQLMGARNLHIVDVHDVNGAGKSARAFGRVFYSEGQSLVFYAFDLPNGKPTPAKYFFKAWGQQEAAASSVHNLGTFEVDDRDQHRWVLKITDPSLLKGIDSVFVTAETVGDHKQPEGKRLLYAYLAGNANHP